ncbi:GTPase IMAP family member 7 [Aplysia californica]|uniref:GTPase IMAP family member 7 n=1 Tax=Aplysia californica TaxID=6500 RepID=A0ABM1A7C0_APLCA|nr:GTPase IMAP family member 7 [Aplysia californica]
MLLGKVGHGKTATASSILERSVSHMDESTTDVFLAGSCVSADGVSNIAVIDSPGLFDTWPIDDVLDTTRMFDHIKEAINISADGITAFVIVFRYGARYTDDEQKVVCNLEQTFGPRFFAEHVIVLFTHGEDYRMRHGCAPFEDWVLSQMADVQKLYNMCRGRCLLFMNVTRSVETASEQRRKLLNVLSGMTEKFTITDYREMRPNIDKLLSVLKKSSGVRGFLRNMWHWFGKPIYLTPLFFLLFLYYFRFHYRSTAEVVPYNKL